MSLAKILLPTKVLMLEEQKKIESFLSNCTICGKKLSSFTKNQETSGSEVH